MLTGLLAAGSASAQTLNDDGSETLWTATLTTKTTYTGGLGFWGLGNQGALTSESFTYGGTNFYMNFFGINPNAGACTAPNKSALSLVSLYGGWGSSEASWVLHVGSHTFDFADAARRRGSEVVWCGVTAADLGWSDGGQVAVKIVKPYLRATLFLDPDVISENEGVSTVTATLDRSSTAETTITVSASAVDPATASDFTLSSDKTLTIAAGATTSTGTVTISAVNNTADDDNRQVTVSGVVVNTEGVTAPQDVTLTIADDESASTKVTLTVSPTSVREDARRAYEHGAAETTVTVTAALDRDARGQTEVTVSVSGDSATAGTDYTAVQDFTITIAAGETSGTGTFTLAPIDDLVDEPDETVTVTGTTTSGLSVEPATIRIEDNDYAPTVNGGGSVTLWEATLTTAATTNYAAAPGYYHNLNQGALTSNSFTYAGTTFAMDFFGIEPNSGNCTGPNNSALELSSLRGGTWGSSEASWVLHVGSHTFDFADAGVRSGTRALWCGVTAADLGWAGGDTVAVKIVRPPTQATLVLDPDVISENGGVSAVTATLNQTSTAETTITVSASAVPPAAASDFTLSSDTTLTLAAGATTSTGTVTITAVYDGANTDDKQVTVSGAVANTEGVTAPNDETLTITDDSTSTKVTLSVSPTSVAEDATGSDRTVTVTAALDADPFQQATDVWVAVRGDSAVAKTDFRWVSSFKVTIDEGETSGSGTFTLAPIDDNLVETDETVTVRGTVVSGLPVESATVTIEDNDAPTVRLVLDRKRISENVGVSTVTATLNQTMNSATTVTVSASAVSPAMDSATLSPHFGLDKLPRAVYTTRRDGPEPDSQHPARARFPSAS